MTGREAEDSPPRIGPRGLYGRATLFVVVGSGALFGALLLAIQLIVWDARDRILDERAQLARFTARFVDDRLRAAEQGVEAPRATSDDVLRALEAGADDRGTEVYLLDRAGEVIASTARTPTSRAPRVSGALADAVRRGEAFQGIRSPRDGADRGEDLVSAFAPVPGRDLGVLILQAEREALAPVRGLGLRMLIFGASVIVLFVAFNALSVHSVVAPVQRLTSAVRRAEARGAPMDASGYGNDEVGLLAAALGDWHARVTTSLREATASREALRHETEAISRHLQDLQAISDASTGGPELQPVLQAALERVASLLGSSDGALSLHRDDQKFSVVRGAFVDAGDAALESVQRRGQVDLTVPERALARARLVRIHTPSGALYGVSVRPEAQVAITVAVRPTAPPDDDAAFWIVSLLRHTAMCAAQLLLRDIDRERREQQAQYLHRVMRAQEDERSRVARDLHDTVAQDLAALRLEAERLSAKASAAPELAAPLRDFERRAREMLETVRRILLDLRLSILESMGFVSAVRWLLDRMERERGVHTHLLLDGGEDVELPYEVAITLFRIAQESLLNVAQHAEAEHVLVTVRLATDAIELTIEDDGRGFDPRRRREVSADPSRGLGLLGMQERASLLGGELSIQSAPGEGTTVHVRVPGVATGVASPSVGVG